MNKRLLLSIVLMSVVAGVIIGYVRALPDDFVEPSEIAGDFGYRCGDGSEFTLVPEGDMQSIRIVPATSVDYVHDAMLTAFKDAVGIYYSGEGIVIRPSASGLILAASGHATTTCASMLPSDESLFNVGE